MPRKRFDMARNRAQQRATRERMADTGENYTTARTALLSGPLYLLTITTKHGDSHELYTNEDAAKHAVYDYVVQYWSEVGRWSDADPSAPVPEDKDEAIALYFEDSPEDDWSIEPVAVMDAPKAGPVGSPKLDVAKLGDSELIELLRKANEEYAKRNEGSLVEVLRELLSEDEAVELAGRHGAPVRVFIDTMDYENGYFFHASPTVVFADGTIERGLEMDALEDVLTEVSSDYQPLTGDSTLMVLLENGVVHFEQVGHTIRSLPKDAGRLAGLYERYTPKQTRVYETGDVIVAPYAWECTHCQALSGLQWDTQEAAGTALAHHLKEHEIPEEAPKETPKRYCFFIDESMYTPNGYIPSVVTEDEPGHSPMMGKGELSQPWYWGKDIDTAKRIARESNEKLGLSDDDVDEIVTSSITAAIRQQGREDAARERLENLRRGIS